MNDNKPPAADEALDQFDALNAPLLAGFTQLCVALGATADIEEVEADGDASSDRLSYRRFVKRLSTASRELNCPDFGMRLAISQSGRELHGPLGTVMRRSQTFGDALDYVLDNAHVHSSAARITQHAIPGRQGIVLSHEIIVGDFADQEQAIEYVLLAGHLGAMVLTRGRSRARQVLLRHRPVSPPAAYRRRFGCEVLFDQPLDALIFSRSDLANPIVGFDKDVHAQAVAAVTSAFPLRHPPLELAVRAAILRLMQVGLASNDRVASELGMNIRSLHRRLRAVGATFQTIKDAVRCELARYYLSRSELSLTWISGKLDFSEQAVFTRFCRKHLGAAPSEIRARLASLEQAPCGSPPQDLSDLVKRGRGIGDRTAA